MRTTCLLLCGFFVASSAFAQDPITVDPKHHKLEFQNADVRVLRLTFGPGEKAPAHEHPNGFAVFLTDGKMRVSPVGGSINEDPRKRGDVVPLAAGIHTVDNLGGAVEILLVELKNPASKMWKAPARDATKVDPKHYKVAGENDQARALKIAYGPNETSVMHDHPSNVAVFLTDGHIKMGMADGISMDRKVTRGTTQYTPQESHMPSNIGGPFEVVLVELKSTTVKPGP